MCELTYANHFRTVIQAVIPDGETLGELTGPGVFFIKTDGDDAAYAEAVRNELKIADPLDNPPAEAAMKAKADKVAKAAKEAQAGAKSANGEKAPPKNAKPAHGHETAHK